MKLKQITQTCFACPAQWEGETDDGQFLYVRYRWGWLTAGLGATANDAVMSDPFFAEKLGDSLDGWMDFDEMLTHIGATVE